MAKNIVAFLTDFGNKDGYVGVLKGTILQYTTDIRFIDLSNGVNSYDIESGRFILYNSYKHFPKGTIFFCVIDPGVGTNRDIIFVKSGDYYFLGPDNGLLDWVCSEQESSFYNLKNDLISTFQARDIMAPFLGNFLSKKIKMKFKKKEFKGLKSIDNLNDIKNFKIIYIDKFGNEITNIKNEVNLISLEYKGKKYYPITSYSEKSAENKLIKGSSGFWELAGSLF